MGVTRFVRLLYAVVASAFVVGLIVQVFLIGLFIFNQADGSAAQTHMTLGWVLHLVPLLILALAFLARAGRGEWLWALALALVVFLVPIFATMRAESVAFAALHPVSAMAAFALAVVVAWNAIRVARAPIGAPVPAE